LEKITCFEKLKELCGVLQNCLAYLRRFGKVSRDLWLDFLLQLFWFLFPSGNFFISSDFTLPSMEYNEYLKIGVSQPKVNEIRYFMVISTCSKLPQFHLGVGFCK